MALRWVENPPNPYLGAFCEYLGPPPDARIEVYEEQVRSLLCCNDSPDIPYRWSVNPYRGCQHGCAYCYARPSHEYLGLGAGTDFETRLIVKVNAPEVLRRELARPGWRRDQIAFSGVTDCYQPLEAIYRLTRQCLEVCLDACTPVGIVTKAYLVVRDLDLLTELRRRAGVHVMFSIPFADERVSRRIEPSTPSPARRFEAMRRLHAGGIPVGVMVAPLIPGLNDRDVPAILRRAAECGARSATYTPLRLPGSVRAVFLSRLRKRLPERARRVEQRIREMRGGRWNDPRFFERMRGRGPYWESVEQLFARMARRYGLWKPECTGADTEPRADPAAARCAPARPGVRQLPLFAEG